MEMRYAALMASSLLLLLLLLPQLISSSALHEKVDKRGAANTGRYRRLRFGKYRDTHPLPSYKLPPSSSLPPTTRRSFALAVEGVVHCQHCKRVGTNSLLGSNRLAGAKVRLACRNGLYKTFVYKTTYTNTHGYFKFHVDDYHFRLHNGVRNCIVYLVLSPSQSCYKTTNINKGRIGAPLTRQKVYPDVILYSIGPFAFSPPSCNTPSSYFRLSKARYGFSPSI